jgi:luciferase family oxidoreductase group 1
MLKFGVLDQSPICAGGTAAQAIDETVRLAQETEALGFSRYWLAEHHGTDGYAGSSPEIMIARVAGATRSIRVGSGGVMLSHYSPLKVAENFKLLENMYPGRIDLGIGRAPGSDGLTAAALAYGNQIGIEYFPTKIADLTAFLTDSVPPTEAFERVRATPKTAGTPELWLLGSSDQSAAYAAHFGMAFSFAHFIAPENAAPVLAYYRDQFKPSELLAAPKASAGVFVICADTEEEAERLAASRDYWRLMLGQGRHVAYVPPEEALAYPYTPQQRAQIAANRANRVTGTPQTVRPKLEALARDLAVDELVILTITYDFAARVTSYRLLAEAFGLDRREAA